MTELTESVVTRLEALGRMMSDSSDDWCVIGGTALVLLGVEGVEVRDIDVLLSERDALAVLEQLGLERPKPSGDRKFRSKVYLQIAPEPEIDLMADLEVSAGRSWTAVEPRPHSVRRFGGYDINLPSPEGLKEMLLLFDRPKDIQRLALLEAWAGTHHSAIRLSSPWK